MIEFLNKFEKYVVGVDSSNIQCKLYVGGYDVIGNDLIIGDEDCGIKVSDISHCDVVVYGDEMDIWAKDINAIVIGVS